jgi:hypothetical protein
MRSSLLSSACASALICALLAAGAAGADDLALDRAWSGSVVARGPGMYYADVVGIAPGQAVVLRTETAGAGTAIVATLRDASAGTRSDQTLAAANVSSPSLAGSYAGGAVAAWLEAGQTVVAERRPGASAFTQAFAVSTCCNDYSGNRPHVAVGRRGDAVVAWLRLDGGGAQHVMAAYRPPGGAFGAPEDVASTTAALLRDVALGADGTVALGWVDSGGPATVAIRAPATGHWGAPEGIGNPQRQPSFGSPVLGVDGAGRVAAAWLEASGGVTAPAFVAYRDAGAAGFGPAHATGLNTIFGGVELAVSDAGEVILAAQVMTGELVDGVWAALGTTVRQDVGAPAAITDRSGMYPVLSMDARGDAVIAWNRELQLGARRRAPGGGFDVAVDVQAPAALAAEGGSPLMSGLDVDDAGNADATWTMFNGPPAALFAAADGPIATAVGAPVTTVAAALPPVLAPGVLRTGGPAGPGPARAPYVPLVAPFAPVVPVVPAPAKPVALSVRARLALAGPRTRRRAQLRVRCSAACTARVTATLRGKHLSPANVTLARAGEKLVKLALPRSRARTKAWLVVRVSATSRSGRHAAATARVRVP